MSRGVFVIWVAALALMGVGAATAQDAGDGDHVPVVDAPVYISVDHTEPLALYVKTTGKDVASVAVLVQTKAGWVQMTPCNNADVPCADVVVAADANTTAGDIFYLKGE